MYDKAVRTAAQSSDRKRLNIDSTTHRAWQASQENWKTVQTDFNQGTTKNTKVCVENQDHKRSPATVSATVIRNDPKRTHRNYWWKNDSISYRKHWKRPDSLNDQNDDNSVARANIIHHAVCSYENELIQLQAGQRTEIFIRTPTLTWRKSNGGSETNTRARDGIILIIHRITV